MRMVLPISAFLGLGFSPAASVMSEIDDEKDDGAIIIIIQHNDEG